MFLGTQNSLLYGLEDLLGTLPAQFFLVTKESIIMKVKTLMNLSVNWSYLEWILYHVIQEDPAWAGRLDHFGPFQPFCDSMKLK